MAIVDIKGPWSWLPSDYYASDYADVTQAVDFEETSLYQLTPDLRVRLLNTEWYFPLQFISDYKLGAVHVDDEGRRYETWWGLSRGWLRDADDLAKQLPNYEPHVLLCSEYAEYDYGNGLWEPEIDHGLYVRSDVLKRPEMRLVRDRWLQWKLRGGI